MRGERGLKIGVAQLVYSTKKKVKKIICKFCLLPEQHGVHRCQPWHLRRPHISRQNGGGGGIALAGEHLPSATAKKRDLQSDRNMLFVFGGKVFIWLKDFGFKSVSCFCSHCCCYCCCC